ncbi:hypothetical protein BDQ17DRAFT_1263243, partial [Cyathus striatus]
SPTVEVCTGSINPQNGCVTIPVVSEQCVDFTGGLTFLDKQVSNAEIPDGFVCVATDCKSVTQGDSVVLNGGTWNFFNVPGANGQTNFNDMTSSFICSAL